MSLGEDHSGEPPEMHNDQLRAIVKADLLRTTGEAAEELNADHSTVTGHF